MSAARAWRRWLQRLRGRPALPARTAERLPPGTHHHLLRDLGLGAEGVAFPCRHAARRGGGRPHRLGLWA